MNRLGCVGGEIALAWEDYLATRAGPPSQTEQTRCDNAERIVRDALRANEALGRRSLKTFLQGSYRNNTNVRQESDVDVGILCTDTYFYDIADGVGITKEAWGWTEATYDYSTYKAEVGAALAEELGSDGVTRGNKAFDIHENTYRVEADVAPFFEYRFYWGPNPSNYYQGVALDPDNGGPRVVNYPEQHYENCVAKNNRTGRRYKQAVRILKRLRNDLGLVHGNEVTGFFIECALYNVADTAFVGTYYDMTRRVVAEAYQVVNAETPDARLLEANEIKYLFHGFQKWTKEGVLEFWAELYGALG